MECGSETTAFHREMNRCCSQPDTLSRLPSGATGKLQRITMAKTLGLA